MLVLQQLTPVDYLVIGNADADDKTADSLTGRLTVGALKISIYTMAEQIHTSG